MSDKDTENNLLYITHKGELLIWLLIVLIIVCISYFVHVKNHEHANSHRIFLPDVDGLIVGSPVRMMGIEVGYVTRIKPLKDEVYVKFLIKDKDIKIPQGTHVTVEFNGMAGSKSLELYLPKKGDYIDSNTPILTVDDPKRLHDAAGLLNEMFKKLGNIIATTSMFGKKLKTIEMPNSNKGDLSKFLQYANEVLDNSTERAEKFGEGLKNGRTK